MGIFEAILRRFGYVRIDRVREGLLQSTGTGAQPPPIPPGLPSALPSGFSSAIPAGPPAPEQRSTEEEEWEWTIAIARARAENG